MLVTDYTCPFCTAALEVEQPPPTGQHIQCPRCGTSFPSTIKDVVDPRAWPETVSLRLDHGSTNPVCVARLSRNQRVEALEVVEGPSKLARPKAEPCPANRSPLSTMLLIGGLIVLIGGALGGGFFAFRAWVVPHMGEPSAVYPTQTLEARSFPEAPPEQPFSEAKPRGGAPSSEPEEKEEPHKPVFADGTPWFGVGKGNLALDFDGEDLDGKHMRLSQFRGKVVLLDFWAHWCVYCRRMYPFERELVKEMENRPFVLVGVNCDKTRSEAKAAVQREQINWPSWFDGDATGRPISLQWNVSSYPRLYLIDHKGVIRELIEGMPRDEQDLKRRIEALVEEAEKEPPTPSSANPSSNGKPETPALKPASDPKPAKPPE